MTISVATPSFKQLEWLRLCVASVRDQVQEENYEGRKLKPVEGRTNSARIAAQASSFKSQISSSLCVQHIIQDGGSPGIEEFAREIGAAFYRDGNLISPSPLRIPNYSLAVYCECDSGMYDAINHAWDNATGDILCYLNSDEQYLPDALGRVAHEFVNNPGADIVFGDAIITDATGTPLSYRRIVRPSAAHTRNVHLGTMSCAMFFQRSLFDRGLRFDTNWKAIGDAEWIFRALKSLVKIRMIHEPLAAFTLTGSNLGANEKALAEAARWRSSGPALDRKLSLFWNCLHFAKKFLSGAYRSRTISVALFIPFSLENRTKFENRRLSYRWPRGS